MQIGLGQGPQPIAVRRPHAGVAQRLYAGGGQSVQHPPVFVALVVGQLRQKVAQQLAAGPLTALHLVVQTAFGGGCGPCTGLVWLRQRHGKTLGADGVPVQRNVQQLLPLPRAGHQGHHRPCQVGGQRLGQQQGQGQFVLSLESFEFFGQRLRPDDVQTRRRAKQVASGLQIGAHGFAPTRQRQQQLPLWAALFTGEQGHAQGQFPNVVALGLVGELVGARRRPNPQGHRKAQHEPPLMQLLQTLLRLPPLRRHHPQLIRTAQTMPPPQVIQGHPLRMVSIQIHHRGREPPKNFRNHRPTRPKGAEEDGFVIGSAVCYHTTPRNALNRSFLRCSLASHGATILGSHVSSISAKATLSLALQSGDFSAVFTKRSAS